MKSLNIDLDNILHKSLNSLVSIDYTIKYFNKKCIFVLTDIHYTVLSNYKINGFNNTIFDAGKSLDKDKIGFNALICSHQKKTLAIVNNSSNTYKKISSVAMPIQRNNGEILGFLGFFIEDSDITNTYAAIVESISKFIYVQMKNTYILKELEIDNTIKNNVDLTNAERDIVHLLSIGKLDKEIASILNISTSTVRKHITSIFEKYGVESRTQFASNYYKSKILDIVELW